MKKLEAPVRKSKLSLFCCFAGYSYNVAVTDTKPRLNASFHERVGAASPITGESVRRISAALNDNSDEDSLNLNLRKSFLLSSDQAHAVHPNYAAKHEAAHQPKMNEGMVIKRNSNQRYATTTMTGLMIREIAKRAGLPPVQEFIVRQGTRRVQLLCSQFFPFSSHPMPLVQTVVAGVL
jgi:aspartyl aminopeptidase